MNEQDWPLHIRDANSGMIPRFFYIALSYFHCYQKPLHERNSVSTAGLYYCVLSTLLYPFSWDRNASFPKLYECPGRSETGFGLVLRLAFKMQNGSALGHSCSVHRLLIIGLKNMNSSLQNMSESQNG